MTHENFRSFEQHALSLAARALGRNDPNGLRSADPPSIEAGDLALGFHGLAKELKSDPQSLATKAAAAHASDPLF